MLSHERYGFDIEGYKKAKHSFGTQLTILIGYISLLQDGSYGHIPSEIAEVLAIIERSSHELQTIAAIFLHQHL